MLFYKLCKGFLCTQNGPVLVKNNFYYHIHALWEMLGLNLAEKRLCYDWQLLNTMRCTLKKYGNNMEAQ